MADAEAAHTLPRGMETKAKSRDFPANKSRIYLYHWTYVRILSSQGPGFVTNTILFFSRTIQSESTEDPAAIRVSFNRKVKVDAGDAYASICRIVQTQVLLSLVRDRARYT